MNKVLHRRFLLFTVMILAVLLGGVGKMSNDQVIYILCNLGILGLSVLVHNLEDIK